MKKTDLKKEMANLYGAKHGKVDFIQVPELQFLCIDGQGDPNDSEAFQEGVEALFSLSYTLKFQVKKSGVADYGVMPLEGQW